jgi:hypothetical protein
MTQQPISAKEAKQLILKGQAPAGLRVQGRLDLSKNQKLSTLPARLQASSLDLGGCTALRALPPGLQVKHLNLNGCTALQELPPGLTCYELEMQNTQVRSLPPDLWVKYRLDLTGCWQLETLPEGLTTGSLILRDCIALTALPEGLNVYFLDISGCINLAGWPLWGSVQIGRLTARDCTQLGHLPLWLKNLTQLDVRGCASLARLPQGLVVSSWIDLAGTQIQSLPDSCQGVQLRWRGVPIDERIAFRPETITPGEILDETNVELRRVLLECMGYANFLQQAGAEVLDRDSDPGGERQLLRVPFQNDEDLVCVSVLCPSTGRQYVVRVPPTMRTCHQAVAWVAGYDNPDDYQPIVET